MTAKPFGLIAASDAAGRASIFQRPLHLRAGGRVGYFSVMSTSAKDALLEAFAEDARDQASFCAGRLAAVAGAAGQEPLAKFLTDNSSQVAAALTCDRSLRKLIFSFVKHVPYLPPDMDAAPTILLNIASVLCLVATRLPAALSEELDSTAATLFVEAVDQLASRWTKACEHQVRPLVTLLQAVLGIIDPLALGAGRILVLELPLGNSIPCRLLSELLQARNRKFEMIRVALSRNDSRKVGVTREALLAERLQEAKIGANDLVVYVDEWNTGANFANLASEIVRVSERAKAFLLPAAALAPDASERDRYASFCRQHDEMARRVGALGDRLRVPFPLLNPGAVNCEQPFFWSEHDRLAGYRKMQHLGSMLGSIFAVVDDLKKDPAVFEQARLLFLEEVARAQNPDNETFVACASEPELFRQFFEEALPDFDNWKGTAEKIDLASNTGVVDDDIENSFIGMAAAIDASTAGRKAKVCVNLAILWIRSMESDPRNQYYFRGHVPVISELPHELSLLSRTFYAHLRSTVLARIR